MGVAIPSLPADWRVPLFYAELDREFSGSPAAATYRTVIIGQRLSTGTIAAGTLKLVSSASKAQEYFGVGSMLARMVEIYIKNDPYATLYAIALDDAGAGAAAVGSITFSGTATENGTIFAYIAGQRVTLGVESGDTANEIATALAAELIANWVSLPVTAAEAAPAVTLTAKHKGALGNSIDVQLNYRGDAGGEKLPAGITAVVVQPTGGSADPTLSTALTAIAVEDFRYIVQPYADDTNLDDLDDELVDRWGPLRGLLCHAFGAACDAYADHVTWGGFRNSAHNTTLCVEETTPTPPWELVAAFCGQVAKSTRSRVNRPVWTLPLLGCLPAPLANRFDPTERNTLLHNGCATAKANAADKLVIDRAATNYQTNPGGGADDTYLDTTTPLTLAYMIDGLKGLVTGKFARVILVDDGVPIGAGEPVVSPSIIEGELDGLYQEYCDAHIAENFEAWQQFRKVERNNTDPNRVDVLFVPDLANAVAVFGVLVRPWLQYPDGVTD